jgi:hypothetical protein
MNSIIGFCELTAAVFGIIITLLILLTRLEPTFRQHRSVEQDDPPVHEARSA